MAEKNHGSAYAEISRITAALPRDERTLHDRRSDRRAHLASSLTWDRSKFFLGALPSWCVDCHNPKQFKERHGYSEDVDEDGWPTDPRHPVNKR